MLNEIIMFSKSNHVWSYFIAKYKSSGLILPQPFEQNLHYLPVLWFQPEETGTLFWIPDMFTYPLKKETVSKSMGLPQINQGESVF